MFKQSGSIVMLLLICGTVHPCFGQGEKERKIKPMEYQVQKAASPVTIDADWNKEIWKGIEPIDIQLFMGEEPEHKPKTQAKLLYDDDNIYVIFRVEDQYVRAVNAKNPKIVCQDSCVEFFFTPGTSIGDRYFNIEVNCGGTMLFQYQADPRGESQILKDCKAEGIEIAHSLPQRVEPEIKEPTTWTLEYRVPFKAIEKYSAIEKPGPGVVWRANLYKCGDKTSHPHWLTWSFVDFPTPNFHLPQFFGTLRFE